jgi:hypothetical protein
MILVSSRAGSRLKPCVKGGRGVLGTEAVSLTPSAAMGWGGYWGV